MNKDSTWKSAGILVRSSSGNEVRGSVEFLARCSAYGSIRDSVEDSVWYAIWEPVRNSAKEATNE